MTSITFHPMTKKLAIESLCFAYEPPYDFYNVAVNEENVKERLDGSYVAAFVGENLIGFYCTGPSARVPAGYPFGAYERRCTDIGVGLKPSWTGQGKGTPFFKAVLDEVEKDSESCLRLSVATFNRRAIRLYSRMGFEADQAFYSGPDKFITMVREATGKKE